MDYDVSKKYYIVGKQSQQEQRQICGRNWQSEEICGH
jgi:hypothetical protein